MKTKKNILIQLFMLSFIFILNNYNLQAQSINKKVAFNEEVTSDYIINYFKAREVNNKIYFKFLVLENRINIAYVLESSNNGKDFSGVQLKEGFKSPNNTPLLYCYKVDQVNNNGKYYRIKRISPDGITYSSIIETAPNYSLTAKKD